jgi:hypothetical protein
VTLVHAVTARNDATSSENKIHDDTVARRYGFGGGLVPGVTVYGFMTWVPVTRWGAPWLSGGTMTARFAKPVYDGDKVEVRGEDAEGDSMTVTVTNDNGVACATGTAALAPPGRAPLDPAAFDHRPAPAADDRLPASAATLAPGTALGVVERGWDAAARARYLDLFGDDLDIYDRLGVAHPGALVRAANEVLARTVRLGPWIHVASETAFHGLVHDDDVVTTYGRVIDRVERKGHQFVELDVLSVVGDRPVLSVRHTAIYEPRRVG